MKFPMSNKDSVIKQPCFIACGNGVVCHPFIYALFSLFQCVLPLQGTLKISLPYSPTKTLSVKSILRLVCLYYMRMDCWIDWREMNRLKCIHFRILHYILHLSILHFPPVPWMWIVLRRALGRSLTQRFKRCPSTPPVNQFLHGLRSYFSSVLFSSS